VYSIILNNKTNKEAAYKKMEGLSDEQLLSGLKMYIKEAEGGYIKLSDLSKTDKENLTKAVHELSMLALLLVSLIRSDDEDDDDKTELEKWFKKNILNRLYTDAVYIWDINSWQGLLNGPAPILKYIYDLSEFIYYLGLSFTDSEKAKYQRDYLPYGKEGEFKFVNRFLKVVPAGSGIYQAKQIFSALDADKVSEQTDTGLDPNFDSVDFELDDMEVPDYNLE